MTQIPMKTLKEAKHIRVFLIQANKNGAKLTKIVEIAQEYFEKKEPLLIKVPHKEAIEYIDLLLWRHPIESFLPHAIKDTPCDDLIVITSSDNNPNSARTIFNLTSHPIEDEFFIRIYEFEGTSSPNKKKNDHYQVYKEKGCTVTLM